MRITGNFERFQCSHFETSFLKTENLFWKTGVSFSSTTIESTTFLYKADLSKANIKKNRMGSTKWVYRKERRFATNYLIFFKIQFQYKNLLYLVDLMYLFPIMSILIPFESVLVLLKVVFSLWATWCSCSVPNVEFVFIWYKKYLDLSKYSSKIKKWRPVNCFTYCRLPTSKLLHLLMKSINPLMIDMKFEVFSLIYQKHLIKFDTMDLFIN